HEPGPDADRPHPERLGAHRLALPVCAHLREEAEPGRARLGEEFLAAIAVVSDRGGAEERSRTLLERGHRLHDRARAFAAALEDLLLARFRPTTARDRL